MSRRLLTIALLAIAAITVAATAAAGHRAGAAHVMTPDTLRTPSIRQQIEPVAAPAGSVQFACQRTSPAGCYGPDQMRAAYSTQALLSAGFDGTGRTIVIIDAYGSPTLAADVANFDSAWGLPAAKLTITAPFGIDQTTPDNADGWSGETSLDVEWAHAIAPGANIALVVAKSNTDSDILDATQYVVDHDLGDVVSQSFGEGEACMAPSDLSRQHRLLQQAVAKGMTLFASSGDQGVGQANCNGSQGYFKSTSTPASDPNVTAVGGTTLHADGTTGAYQSESTWNESALLGGAAAAGGGVSVVYGLPAYQLLAVHDSSMREVPDVSYNAAVLEGLIVAWQGSFFRFGGTSAGSPQWAAIAAIVDQIAQHRMGNINTALYLLATLPGGANPFHDIADGSNNSVTDGNGGTISGFTAVPGYDMATGLGSPNIGAMAPQLARQPAMTVPTG
jgi:subtilase family serine protease